MASPGRQSNCVFALLLLLSLLRHGATVPHGNWDKLCFYFTPGKVRKCLNNDDFLDNEMSMTGKIAVEDVTSQSTSIFSIYCNEIYVKIYLANKRNKNDKRK